MDDNAQASPYIDPGEQPPASGPDAGSCARQDEWRALQVDSLKTIRASAEKWRDGLGALVAIVTGGLVISGPDKASDLDRPWQLGVAGGLTLGVLAVVIGLLNTLGVAAGKTTTITWPEFLKAGGTRADLEANAAISEAGTLRVARRFAASGIVLILAAVGAWLIAPAPSDTPQIQITTRTEILCGKLVSGDDGQFVLDLKGEKNKVTLKFADVVNVAPTTTCEQARISR